MDGCRKFGYVVASLSLSFLFGCSHAPTQAANPTDRHGDGLTILLVSLEDGSIIRQSLDLDADICMKSLLSPATTCFTQGDAIVNSNGVIVGYEMDSETIELQGLH